MVPAQLGHLLLPVPGCARTRGPQRSRECGDAPGRARRGEQVAPRDTGAGRHRGAQGAALRCTCRSFQHQESGRTEKGGRLHAEELPLPPILQVCV